MTKRNLFIIQKDDNKSKYWSDAGLEQEIDLIPQPGSPIKAPIFLIQTIFRRKVPDGYVVRYLNDYPSLSKTLLRLASELLLVLLCLLLRINIYWICHNVNKESSACHPRISNFRRSTFARLSKKIFVTDQLLVRHAIQCFPSQEHKLEAISFGHVEIKGGHDRLKEQIAIRFIESKKREIRGSSLKPIVLFCAGSPAEKSVHFDYLNSLIESANSANFKVIAIVAGDFSTTKRGMSLVKSFKSNPSICLFQDFTRFSPEFIQEYIDFYWRGYDDWSVPFTVYEAASLQKPILALELGFLPQLVKAHGLGVTIALPFTDLTASLGKIGSSITVNSYHSFFEEKNWAVLSEKLREALNGKTV